MFTSLSEQTRLLDPASVRFFDPLPNESDEASPLPSVLFISADGQRHNIYFMEKSFSLQGGRIKSVFALSTRPFPEQFRLLNEFDSSIEDLLIGDFLIGSELRSGGEPIRLTINSLAAGEDQKGFHTKSALIAALFQMHVEAFLHGDIHVTALDSERISYANFGFIPSEENLEDQLMHRDNDSTMTQGVRSSDTWSRSSHDSAFFDHTRCSSRLDRTYSSLGPLKTTYRDSFSCTEMVLPPRSSEHLGPRDLWQGFIARGWIDAKSLIALQGFTIRS